MENNKQLLTEVRKAYRLLFDYQSKLLALVNYIGGKFGYNYNGGYPKFSNNQPRQGSGNLKLWAWDWLNLYFHEFSFGKKDLDNGDSLYFSVFVLNDDGYFLANKKEEKSISELNINDFERPEFSHSKLIFVVGYNYWAEKTSFVKDNWCNTQFTTEEKGVHKEENGTMFFKSYPLENFFEESDVALQLNDFVRECHAVGIPFNQVEMKVG